MSPGDDSSGARVEIAVAVVERDGKFLIGLRPDDVPLAGYWEFPGGKLAPGETAAAAAVRECLEETGLAVRVTSSYPAAECDYPHARLRLSFFACTVVQEVRPLPPRFRWVEAGELEQYTFPPANEALLHVLTRRHASRGSS